MQILLSWLKDFVDFELAPEELAEKLTMLGLETNLQKDPSEKSATLDFAEGIVVARIEKIEPHPNADKLVLCQVRAGEGENPLPIVCGATNIKEGDVVPLALSGARLPGGIKVEKVKIRGQVSRGMMCSERELGIGEDHSGIMILSPDQPLGKPLAEALSEGSGGSASEEEILELDLTPNRGDALSVIGVAREIAALLDVPLRYPESRPEEDGPEISTLVSVSIDDFNACPRYVARLVRGVKIEPSPEWMQKRLEAGGIRAINNVVDVTNYILLELGQPLHAFDLQKLKDSRIIVRLAERGEKFTTLDGENRSLFSDSLLICDGDGPVALAGIMGGLESEVTEDTQDVLIESAFFSPVFIRRTSQKLGIGTEASRRFERTVDPLGQARAADRAARLMAEICGGTVCKGLLDVHKELYRPKEIWFRAKEVPRHLGGKLDVDEYASYFRRLEMKVERESGGSGEVERLKVEIPSFRPDLQQEIDLIEEIARLYGYDKIKPTLPRFRMEPMRKIPKEDLRRRWSNMLADLGFTEVVNYNFDSRDNMDRLNLPQDHPLRNAVQILNPISENESLLRYSMIPRLLNNLKFNLSRGMDTVRIFEFNKVFAPGKEMASETNMLSGLISRGEEKSFWSLSCPEDGFYEIKGLVETLVDRLHFPGTRLEPLSSGKQGCPYIMAKKGLRLMIGKDIAGFVGEIHPDVQEKFEIKQKVFIFDLNFDILAGAARQVSRLRKPPRYPGVKRDIALVVDEEMDAEDVIRVIRKMKDKLVESVEIFDVYRGKNIPEGKKSMAFRIWYQSRDRTLTDEEVNALHSKLARRIEERLDARIR